MTPRVQRVANLIDQYPRDGEVLLFKSIAGLDTSFERTGDDVTDLALGCFANNIPQDINYDGSFDNVSPEYDWAHHKIMGIPFHSYQVLAERGYDLTHEVFYATDFTRQRIQDADVAQQVLVALLSEPTTRITLISEYLLCLYALIETIPPDKLQLVLNWFDNEWDGITINHRVLVCGILFARLGL